MAQDLDARETTINYDGGSLTMTIGNLKSLYGEDTNVFGADGQPKTVSVKGHSRVRVIGGATTTVAPFTREYIQWPTNDRSAAAGGTAIVMSWTGSEGEWTARVAGPLWKLGTFLQSTSLKSVWFYAKGGKGYGPFQKIS
jgi:hypothetical protein